MLFLLDKNKEQIINLKILATFRSQDEYEIEYEYDFSNLVRRVYINTSYTNLHSLLVYNSKEGGLWERD